MPWHTIATMIIVNMCVQCLFNLNFAHVTHINFFFKIKSLSLLLSFLFFFPLMYIRVYIWIMYVCMYVCVCACSCSSCAVLKYFPMKSSLIFISRIASKTCFLSCYKKRSSQSLYIYMYIWKKIQESSSSFFFFHLFFCSRFIFELSRRLLHTNIFLKPYFTFSPDIMFPYYS